MHNYEAIENCIGIGNGQQIKDSFKIIRRLLKLKNRMGQNQHTQLIFSDDSVKTKTAVTTIQYSFLLSIKQVSSKVFEHYMEWLNVMVNVEKNLLSNLTRLTQQDTYMRQYTFDGVTPSFFLGLYYLYLGGIGPFTPFYHIKCLCTSSLFFPLIWTISLYFLLPSASHVLPIS